MIVFSTLPDRKAHSFSKLDVSEIHKVQNWSYDFFFGLEGSWGQPQGPNFPSPWAAMLALRLDCSIAALPTPQKVLPIWRLVELKMLDFSGLKRTGISIFPTRFPDDMNNKRASKVGPTEDKHKAAQ